MVNIRHGPDVTFTFLTLTLEFEVRGSESAMLGATGQRGQRSKLVTYSEHERFLLPVISREGTGGILPTIPFPLFHSLDLLSSVQGDACDSAENCAQCKEVQ